MGAEVGTTKGGEHIRGRTWGAFSLPPALALQEETVEVVHHTLASRVETTGNLPQPVLEQY
jgi:hypothetical protein